VTVGVGTFFLLPGLIWFATRKWWDRKTGFVEAPAGPAPKLEDVAVD